MNCVERFRSSPAHTVHRCVAIYRCLLLVWIDSRYDQLSTNLRGRQTQQLGLLPSLRIPTHQLHLREIWPSTIVEVPRRCQIEQNSDDDCPRSPMGCRTQPIVWRICGRKFILEWWNVPIFSTPLFFFFFFFWFLFLCLSLIDCFPHPSRLFQEARRW